MDAIIDLEFKNTKLIIFGIPDSEMKSIFEKLSGSDYFRFVGWIESEKVYNYFLTSDLAIFPGTHSVLWEQSVGTGLPGIFKFWKGMTHVDLGGNCEFLYEVNKEEIKRLLKEIITNKVKYYRMKKVAEDFGTKIFSYNDISQRALSV